MLDLDRFLALYEAFRPPLNHEQRQVVCAPVDAAVFVVAGPGSGKTASIALRILKLIFVDGVAPERILATTFTVKAAAELRSRLLDWGYQYIDRLAHNPTVSPGIRDAAAAIDINQVVTGTIDSICEFALRHFRDPGYQPPILADDFVARSLMLRNGLLADARYQSEALRDLLVELNVSDYGFTFQKQSVLLLSLWDRLHQDMVDWDALRQAPGPHQEGWQMALDALAAYGAALTSRHMFDFATLEYEVWHRLHTGRLDDFRQQFDAVLVDEYQDTNLLQESLYFELCQVNGGALSVVGDDDQSLYRFRGATVELFANFAARYEAVFGREPQTQFLSTNYRSTPEIVRFVNNFATLDAEYQTVRVAGKPSLVIGAPSDTQVPVLGMFRKYNTELARDLAHFIAAIFRGNGYALPSGTMLRRADEGGDVGDCALLSDTPRQFNSSGKPRLPQLLREELARLPDPIEVFNPRGQDLADIPLVAIFGGLLLGCIDPGAVIQEKSNRIDDPARDRLLSWRHAARQFLRSDTAPAGLHAYIDGWRTRSPGDAAKQWPRETPVLDLMYAIVHYLPQFHDDPEGQIYLEVFTRQLEAAELIGSFKGRVLFDPSAEVDDRGRTLPERAIEELLVDFLTPIATGLVQVNEDLLQVFPRHQLSILSIHQSKGLEFPLTIVDVGSDFWSANAFQAMRRYPVKGGSAETMEDAVRAFTPLGTPGRSGRDRAFDDLYRKFFVAFSRPQQCLLLVGNSAIVPNAASGWDRHNGNHWRQPPYLAI